MGHDVHDIYAIRKNLFGRWYIVHPQHEGDSGLAWSGSRWVVHYKGLPISNIQITNFADPSELHAYALTRLDKLREATIVTDEESTQQ